MAKKDEKPGRSAAEILFDRSDPQPGDWEAARAAFLDDPASPWHTENPKGTKRGK